MAPVVAWLKSPNSVPGGGPAHWSHHGTQWQQRSWISTQTLAPVGPAHSPSWSPDLNITMVLGGKQTLPPQSAPHHHHHGPRWQTVVQRLPSPLCLSSFICLPRMYEPFHFSNPPNSLPHLFTQNEGPLSVFTPIKDQGPRLGWSQLGSSVRTFFKQVWLSSQGPWLVFRMNMFKHFLIVIVKNWM